MKKWILIAFVAICSGRVQSQELNRDDFNFLFREIQQLPSFKDQFKDGYTLKADTVGLAKKTDFELFLTLCQVLVPIRDNHLTFYSRRDSALTKPTIFAIARTKVDSALLHANANDSIAGTYYDGNNQLKLLKFNQDYVGMIEFQGQYFTQFILKGTTPNHFDMIGFAKEGAGYYLNRNMVFINQRLSGTPWKKYKQTDYVNVPGNEPRFDFKKLSDDIAYLKLGSFATYEKNIAASEEFFKKLDKDIVAKHLIVDLRNNGGGGYKTSRKFFDLLKEYKGKIHLLFNSYTISNAEQFIIDLRNWTNVVTYGESTPGTICYGSNADRTLLSPSRRFVLYPTDMKARRQDLPFESIGIKPQINLAIFEKDWISQVVDNINGK